MSQRTVALEALRGDLIARIERYQASKQRFEGALDKDIEDQSIELENSEVVDSLENEAEAELKQVMHALKRIDAGEGEHCDRCAAIIDPKRLVALPYTTRCMHCADLP
ncbi:TraR/DksA family transcriptional regulator [Onishia taeanensis]